MKKFYAIFAVAALSVLAGCKDDKSMQVSDVKEENVQQVIGSNEQEQAAVEVSVEETASLSAIPAEDQKSEILVNEAMQELVPQALEEAPEAVNAM